MDMDLIYKNRKMIAGSIALGALGLWYFSDISSKEHHPSTIKEPSSRNPEYSNYFKNKKGMWIYTKSWLPEREIPVAIVFLVHGHGEHICRKGYHDFATALSHEGYAVFGLDHMGHGKSNGSRGHVRHVTDLCEDFEILVDRVVDRYPGLPLFALGHSMGGCALLTTLVRRPGLFQGIVLSAPAACFHLDPRYPEPVRILGSLVASVFPKFEAIRLHMDGLSRNPVAVKEYLGDPLINHGLLNLQSSCAILQGSRDLWDKLPLITTPIFIIHGQGDTIVHPIGSQHIHDRIGSTDKQLILYPEVKHELWEDPEKDNMFQLIIAWLGTRLQGY